MPIPQSFINAGYIPVDQLMKYRLIIGVEGPPDSGKSEFMFSAPGPNIITAIDRGHNGALINPNPPKTRGNSFVIVPVAVPSPGGGTDANGYLEHWRAVKAAIYKAVDIPDAKTACLDGDTESWALQRLAAFKGQVSQIPPLAYTEVNQARHSFLTRMKDSGKNIILSSKVKEGYMDKLDEAGIPQLSKEGNVIRVRNGVYERQGYGDMEWFYDVELICQYTPGTTREITAGPRKGTTVVTTGKFGILITKCKPKREVEGTTLWGSDCCFSGLVKFVFPNIPLSVWGF